MGKKIIEGFKKKVFSLKFDDEFREQARHKNIRNKIGLIDSNKFMELIKLKENEMNNELVRKYFFVQNIGNLLKQMKDLKNNPDKKIRVLLIKIRLKDLKNEIGNMIEEEKKIEKTIK